MLDINQEKQKHLTYNEKMTVFNPVLEGINFLPGGLGSKTNLSTILLKNNKKKQRKSQERYFDNRFEKPVDFGTSLMTNQMLYPYRTIKKVNTEPMADTEKSSWFYLNHRGSFVKFSSVINEYLENHYFVFIKGKRDKMKLDFNMNGDKYRLKFCKLGKKSRLLLLSWIKVEVPICRTNDEVKIFQQAYSSEYWLWKNNYNVFEKYQWYENDLLSFYYNLYTNDSDKNMTFHIRLSSGKSYEIDFTEMTQRNLETKGIRVIQRYQNVRKP